MAPRHRPTGTAVASMALGCVLVMLARGPSAPNGGDGTQMGLQGPRRRTLGTDKAASMDDPHGQAVAAASAAQRCVPAKSPPYLGFGVGRPARCPAREPAAVRAQGRSGGLRISCVARTGCVGCRVVSTPAVLACMRERRCRASVRSQRWESQSGCRRRCWITLVIRRVCRGRLASSRPHLGDGSSGGPRLLGVCVDCRGM